MGHPSGWWGARRRPIARLRGTGRCWDECPVCWPNTRGSRIRSLAGTPLLSRGDAAARGDTFILSRRTAFLTGGSSGLGLEIATALGADGWQVIAPPRTMVNLRKAPDQIEEAIDQALGTTTLDAVICAAAVSGPLGPTLASEPAEWDRAIQVNLLGTYLTVRHAGGRLRAGGRILTFGGAGDGPNPGCSAYAASKAGIIRLTEAMAAELREAGITCNAILPGPINTPGHEAFLHAGLARQEDGGDPIRVVDLVRFLLSPEAQHVTGKAISVRYDDWKAWAPTISETAVATYRRIRG